MRNTKSRIGKWACSQLQSCCQGSLKHFLKSLQSLSTWTQALCWELETQCSGGIPSRTLIMWGNWKRSGRTRFRRNRTMPHWPPALMLLPQDSSLYSQDAAGEMEVIRICLPTHFCSLLPVGATTLWELKNACAPPPGRAPGLHMHTLPIIFAGHRTGAHPVASVKNPHCWDSYFLYLILLFTCLSAQ